MYHLKNDYNRTERLRIRLMRICSVGGMVVLLLSVIFLITAEVVDGAGGSLAESFHADEVESEKIAIQEVEAAAGPCDEVQRRGVKAVRLDDYLKEQMVVVQPQEIPVIEERIEGPVEDVVQSIKPKSEAPEIVVPYDEDYVLRVLTAEVGNDEALAYCVTQCLYNACEKYGWEYTPAEMLVKYKYTGPADWISDAVRQAYDDIFQCGVTCTTVGDALYFYAPEYMDGKVPWHETQRFIVEVNGVRFFGEVKR